MSMQPILERALAARRASRRIAFRSSFDQASDRDWCELLRDVAAMANSGGGVILFAEIAAPEASSVVERLQQYTDSQFEDVDLEGTALIVGESVTPIVFTKACANVIVPGSLYFRRGAKSRPASTEDLARAIDRIIQEVRRSWLSAVRRVVRSPVGVAPVLVPSAVRDSDSPDALPIRVVDDPRAPAYRVVDYDKTHPYRQKELLVELRRLRPEVPVNQFDLLAVRNIHAIGSRPEFAHQAVYGTRQYSPAFLDWLLQQLHANPRFFEEAKRQYLSQRAQKTEILE